MPWMACELTIVRKEVTRFIALATKQRSMYRVETSLSACHAVYIMMGSSMMLHDVDATLRLEQWEVIGG